MTADLTPEAIAALIADCHLAADVLDETDSFLTGQSILRQAADTIAALRAMPAPDPVAEAARVLIPALVERHREWAVAKGRNPIDYASKYSTAADTLYALAQEKPHD